MSEKIPNHMISEIKLPEELSKSYTISDQKTPDGQEKTIPNLSKVNLFIGANNSGKSRFLRGVFGERTFLFRDLAHKWDIVIDNLNSFFRTCSEKKNHINQYESVLKTLKLRINEIAFINNSKNYQEALDEFYSYISDSLLRSFQFGGNQLPEAQGLIDFLKQQWEPDERDVIPVQETYFQRTYIPTLRGLRPFDKDEKPAETTNEDSLERADNYQKFKFDNLYENRTIKDYFSNKNEVTILKTDQNTFTGIEMFTEVFKRLLGDETERNLIKEYEEFLSEEFFEDRSISLLPKKGSDVLSVKLGNEEHPVYELGDGIQQLIIMTFPVFLHQESNLLLSIEEPELYLHPGIQRQLMDILLHHIKFENVQTFVTTHSNHLLDLTLDLDNISVYRFEKDEAESTKDPKNPQFIVRNTSNNDKSLLQELGVKSSSVFHANCTIWVEGITDRWYIRRYLKLYMEHAGLNKFKEDYHYAFVEYGGSNLPHWSFLEDEEKPMCVERLSTNSLLVMDRDDYKGKKKERIDELEEKLGENFIVLPCREIENLILPEVLTDVIKYREQNDEVDLTSFKAKNSKNWRLGRYIETQLKKHGIQKHKIYAADSGTIKEKRKFAGWVLEYTDGYDKMSDDAIEIARCVYEFIERSNYK